MARSKVTFTYTGASQEYTVPAGVTELDVKLLGAEGGIAVDDTAKNSKGGYVEGVLPVTPGEVLTLYVGEHPADAVRTGGWNGGGDGGLHTETNRDFDGAGGGGATDIRRGGTTLSDRVLVAGGGGGSTGREDAVLAPEGMRRGGYGGNYNDGTAERGDGRPGGGYGGSQTAGGSLGGALGIGGNGDGGTTTAEGYTGSGGGGGGGYYGGGGGEEGFIDSFNNPTNGRGGGGGSNLVIPEFSVEFDIDGINRGHGLIEITANTKPTVTVTSPAEGGTVTVPRPTYQWNYSDPEGDAQKAYRVKIFTQSQFEASGFNPETSSAAFDSGKTFSSDTSHRFSGDLTNNTVYRAYVKVWETDIASFESASAWDYNEFTVANQSPVVDITAPIGTIQDTSQPTATWTYDDPEGDLQEWISLQLFEGSNLIWYMSVEPYTSTSKELPALNNGTYTLYLDAFHAFGGEKVKSNQASETFTIDIPPPPIPNITADYDPITASISVNADNTGGNPATEEIDIQYFDLVTNSWREVRDYPNPLIVDANQAVGPVVDYEYAPNIENRYRARARYFDDVTGNTYVSSWNEVAVTPVQEEWWLKNLSDPSLNIEVYPNGTELRFRKPRDMAFFEPLGRKHKLAVKSVIRGDEFPLTLDTLTQEQYDALEAILESSITHTLLLQSPMTNGKQWYVEVENPVDPVMRNMVQPWYQFEVSFIEVTKP